MSVNKVILIGNVGKDPDVRYLENNVRVANFPLATTERGYTMSNGTQSWYGVDLPKSQKNMCAKELASILKAKSNLAHTKIKQENVVILQKFMPTICKFLLVHKTKTDNNKHKINNNTQLQQHNQHNQWLL